ncbi:hypothetical protein GN956_G24494 [Arapaima gigas]
MRWARLHPSAIPEGRKAAPLQKLLHRISADVSSSTLTASTGERGRIKGLPDTAKDDDRNRFSGLTSVYRPAKVPPANSQGNRLRNVCKRPGATRNYQRAASGRCWRSVSPARLAPRVGKIQEKILKTFDSQEKPVFTPSHNNLAESEVKDEDDCCQDEKLDSQWN